MRRSAFFSLVATAATIVGVAASGALPAACDSTLNLSGGEAGADATAPDATAGGDATCPGVCDKFIACGYGEAAKRSLCVSDCLKQASQPLLDCVARSACSEIQSACSSLLPEVGIPTFDSSVEDNDFEIRDCQSGCDSVHFFDCLTASQYATCRDLCATAPASKRNTFRGCASGAGSNCTKAQDCFGVFVGD
jgi:hypothetical protein